MNLTAIIHAIAMLDNVLSNETGIDEPVISITLEPEAFDLLVEALRRGRPEKTYNRITLDDITIRKAIPFRQDTTQPEIKRTPPA